MEDNRLVCMGWKGVEGAQGGPRGEGEVSIECLQSSEFVVGKQANFNGAVTIINCTDAPGVKEGKVNTEENIVIRDRVVAELSQGGNDTKRKLADLKQTFIKWRAEHRKLALFFLFLLIFIGVLTTTAIALVVLLPEGPPPPQIVNSTDSHPFYSKQAWKGKPEVIPLIKMKLPVPYAVVSHTVTPQCHNLTSCAVFLRQMQNDHINRRFGDIAYNFLVDSSGGIYEGRGWERRNVNGWFVHGRSVDLALMGNFSEDDEPSEGMMEGLKYLLAFGVADGKLAEDYSLVAANQTYSTLSPGKNVYKVIKGWPHFDDNPKAHIKE